jgi:hypothetical protein
VWYCSTWFWNCSDSVIFFYMFFYMISELFSQCDIFLQKYNTVRIVQKWYRKYYTVRNDVGNTTLSEQFKHHVRYTTLSEQFRNHIEKHVEKYMISELFWQCGIFRHDFGTVLTVWYFSIWFLNCSDSVVYFYMISEEKYNTVRAVPKSCRKIPHCQKSSEIMLKKHVEKYNTVRAVPKSCKKIPHCQNSSEMI